MGLFDSLFRSFGVPTLQWSHADQGLVTYLPPTGAAVAGLAVIKGDETWEVEQTNNGERRVRFCPLSIRAADMPTPALKGKIKFTALGETWEIRQIISRDDNYVRVGCVKVEPHEQHLQRARR